jgi:hypothetical protein
MKDKVKERWAILRIALREGRVAQGGTSVRNHPGFSLFTKERVGTPSITPDIASMLFYMCGHKLKYRRTI